MKQARLPRKCFCYLGGGLLCLLGGPDGLLALSLPHLRLLVPLSQNVLRTQTSYRSILRSWKQCFESGSGFNQVSGSGDPRGQFDPQKCCNFSPIFGHQHAWSGSAFDLKCWIRIRTRWIRIRTRWIRIRTRWIRILTRWIRIRTQIRIRNAVWIAF